MPHDALLTLFCVVFGVMPGATVSVGRQFGLQVSSEQNQLERKLGLPRTTHQQGSSTAVPQAQSRHPRSISAIVQYIPDSASGRVAAMEVFRLVDQASQRERAQVHGPCTRNHAKHIRSSEASDGFLGAPPFFLHVIPAPHRSRRSTLHSRQGACRPLGTGT